MLDLLQPLIKYLPRLYRPSLGTRNALAGFMGQGAPVTSWMNTWTDSRHELVRHFRSWVFVAVDKVATAVAMHAPNVSHTRDPHTKPGAKEKWLSPAQRSKALTPLLSHEQIEPAKADHPLCRLLADPNEPDTSYDLMYETVMYLLLTGSAYWWVPPAGSLGRPGAIWVLPSHWVFPHTSPSGSVDCYEIRPVEGRHSGMAIPAEDVIHFKRKSPVSKIDGHSPLTAGSRWVDCAESVDRTRWYSFKNGVFPGVSVEFDEGTRLPDEHDLDRIEARLAQRYGGEHNTNKPIFVPPGAKLKKIQLSPQELMFCESADQLRDNVLALFGVPSTIAQVNTGMTYGSVIAAQNSFYSLTLNPFFRYLGQQLTEKLAWRWERGLRIWWEDRTPQDPELLERQLMTDASYGARTMNEVRSLRGLEPYPDAWANEPWIPLNTLPVTQALKYMGDRANKGSQGANHATQSDPNNQPQ